ncbi:MAG: Hsp20/alpha crystallin family protein [Bacillota bacterium]
MAGKYNPFDLLKNVPCLDDDFVRGIVETAWPDPTGLLKRLGGEKWPPVNVVETETEIIVTAALPGLRQAGDVRVELKGNTLFLEGEIGPEPQLLSAVAVHLQERRQGKFSRAITLPVPVSSRSARASYRRGILEVKLAKLPGHTQTLVVEFNR